MNEHVPARLRKQTIRLSRLLLHRVASLLLFHLLLDRGEEIGNAETRTRAESELRQVHLAALQRVAEPLELALKLWRPKELLEVLRRSVLLRQVLHQPLAHVLAAK